MGQKTDISWTDATWSPLRARVKTDAAKIATEKGYMSLVRIAEKMAGHVGPHCERVSPGCDNCYSDTNNGRCLPANGTGMPFDRRSRDLVEPFVDENILRQPLKWRTPQRIFVENQSDLFGEWNTDEMIDEVFDVFSLTQGHIYQVLTKRVARMLDYIARRYSGRSRHEIRPSLVAAWQKANGLRVTGSSMMYEHRERQDGKPYAMANVWLGVSVEDQKTADERIPTLLRTPAAKRFVSYEPALGPVDLKKVPGHTGPWGLEHGSALIVGEEGGWEHSFTRRGMINWIIVGGESGSGSRPFEVSWARQTIDQCKEAGMACFVKQLGSFPVIPGHRQAHYDWGPGIGLLESTKRFTAVEPHRESSGMWRIHLKDRKGGDMAEWPTGLRVREFPS